DDGDVVARPESAFAAVVAAESAWLRGGRRRRTIATKRVIAIKRLGRDVLDMNVTARGNALAGESNDLPELVNAFALGDVAQGQLLPQPVGLGDDKPPPAVGNLGPWGVVSGRVGTVASALQGAGDRE